MKKENKKYLIVFDKYCGNKYMGEFVSEATEKDMLKSIRDKFSTKYWNGDLKISKIYEIKENVTLQMLEKVNSEMKRCRDEKAIQETLTRAKYGW